MRQSPSESGLNISNGTKKSGNLVTRIYLGFCALVFIISAVQKLTADFSNPFMNEADFVFPFIKAKYLLFAIVPVNLFVASMLIKKMFTRPIEGVKFALWLSLLFVLYFIAFLYSPGRAGVCKCFGVSLFGFMEPNAVLFSLAFLGIMLLGGIILVLWDWFVRRREMKKI
ncbi:MAG: hypothetical protein EOM03_02970 [Clostridia bacterium]|nr:hypothetical protein [Bacteroidia bacterium]NCC83073.1 hypothetical protein [Clostridia bacterium]